MVSSTLDCCCSLPMPNSFLDVKSCPLRQMLIKSNIADLEVHNAVRSDSLWAWLAIFTSTCLRLVSLCSRAKTFGKQYHHACCSRQSGVKLSRLTEWNWMIIWHWCCLSVGVFSVGTKNSIYYSLSCWLLHVERQRERVVCLSRLFSKEINRGNPNKTW